MGREQASHRDAWMLVGLDGREIRGTIVMGVCAFASVFVQTMFCLPMH